MEPANQLEKRENSYAALFTTPQRAVIPGPQSCRHRCPTFMQYQQRGKPEGMRWHQQDRGVEEVRLGGNFAYAKTFPDWHAGAISV
jgi:hypothetical protein